MRSKKTPVSLRLSGSHRQSKNNQAHNHLGKLSSTTASNLPALATSSDILIPCQDRGNESESRLDSHEACNYPIKLRATNKSSSGFICSGCGKAIKRDRFLLKACDKYWHESCLRCDQCHAKLAELGNSLYCKSNMHLCRQDYLDLFGDSGICSICDKLIHAYEMVMRARDNVYHLECFACQLCNLRFCVGERFYLCQNKIVCQYDFDEHMLQFERDLMGDLGPNQNVQHHQQQQQNNQQGMTILVSREVPSYQPAKGTYAEDPSLGIKGDQGNQLDVDQQPAMSHEGNNLVHEMKPE